MTHTTWLTAALALLVTGSAGCVRSAVPDPQRALRAYADAAARSDSAAVYGMLTDRSKRSLGRAGVDAAMRNARVELAEQAKALRAVPALQVQTRAAIRYPDGEIATLDVENGQFRIASADALPAAARTPTQALEQFRRVVARRSYAGLLRVLSKETRNAIERDLRALVTGLEQPETLAVEVKGERATVRLVGGHIVRLRREAGAWQVDDFE